MGSSLTSTRSQPVSCLDDAKRIIKENNFPFVDLPKDTNDLLWNEIEVDYSLSLAHVSALKNAACDRIVTGSVVTKPDAGCHIKLPLVNEVDLSRWPEGAFRPTKELSALMTKYAGFPQEVFVRKEMLILWKILIEGVEVDTRFAIVGSPGVGKSALLVLLCFYLACAKNRNIFLCRKVDKGVAGSKGSFALLCFHGDHHHVVGFSGLWAFSQVQEVYGRFEMECGDGDIMIAADGWCEQELKNSTSAAEGLLGNFNLLATSAQYRAKGTDRHVVCLLPAWQKNDLVHFAKSTSDIENRITDDDELEYRFYFAGGSIREFFFRPLSLLVRQSEARVSSGLQQVTLDSIVSEYGSARAGVDSLQRSYLVDPSDSRQYTHSPDWKVLVDPGFARCRLAKKLALQSLRDSQAVAKASRNLAWYGWAFEAFIHKLAAEMTGGTIRSQMYRDSNASRRGAKSNTDSTARFEIRFNEIAEFVCNGNTRADCIKLLEIKFAECLRDKDAVGDVYWCPDNSCCYPALGLGAVIILRKRKIVLYLQITVGEKHSFSYANINSTHSALLTILSANRNAKRKRKEDVGDQWSFAYLALLPSKDRIESFVLDKSAGDTPIAELPPSNIFVGYVDESEHRQLPVGTAASSLAFAVN